MKLANFICFDAVIPRLKATGRDEAILELVTSLHGAGKLGGASPAEITEAVIKRENEASTGIGKGVAVPHTKHASIEDVVATIGCSEQDIDFSSLDKQPTYSVILLLSPADNADRHLQAMETIFKNLQKDDFRRFIRQARTLEEIKETIVEADADE
ncbi:MAG: PTS sugar transporter subunit IIA [Planctomycetes bacterium]|nr:PTS sugar transporter subunit IIA [Planctomycetota bacterium]